MTLRKHWRFNSPKPDASSSDIETDDVDSRRSSIGFQVEKFILDFEPLIEQFLRFELGAGVEAETALRETMTRFRDSMAVANCSRSILYRESITRHLPQALLTEDQNRFSKRLLLGWRQHIVSSAWEKLRQKESETEQPYYTVLRRRYQKPFLSCQNLLYDLHRELLCIPGRESFRDFVLESESHLATNVIAAVKGTIYQPDHDTVHEELNVLDLAHFLIRITAPRQSLKSPQSNPHRASRTFGI